MLELAVAMLLVVGATGFIIVGLAGALPDERKVKREIAVRHVQRISSIVDGEAVAIRGEVEPAREGVTKAPLSGRDCVYWMIVEGKRSKKTGGAPFNLRDASGVTRIVPIDARLAVPAVRREAADGGAVEYAILPGATVTIVGWCTFEPDPDAVAKVTGYRKELPTRPVVSGTRRQRLLIG